MMSTSSMLTRLPLGGSQGYPGRQNKLYNSIVNVSLVYGIDETTCRGLDMQEKGSIQEAYDSLIHRDIKLRFLQVLAPGQIYPQRKHVSTTPVATTPTVDGPTSLVDGAGMQKKFRMEDVGLAWATVDTLHYFMYPEGAQFHVEELEPRLLPMVLTNVEGSRSYAVGLKFTRPFFIQKTETGKGHHYHLTPWTFSGDCPPNCKLIYLPTCVVLVSEHPFYNFMKDALSGFYRLISVDDEDVDFWEIVNDFADKMFLIPTIPDGLLGLEVQLPGFTSSNIIMPPRRDLHLDVRLDYPFRFLSVDDILNVVAALLCEQRIIITSSHYTMPAIIIQCLLAYIYPFEFRHPIVSILPPEQLELLGAIGTNIMGCHVDAQDTPEFREVDETVIIKLDEHTIEYRFQEPLPSLPAGPAQRFKTHYIQMMKNKFEIDGVERLTLGSAVERERSRINFEHYQDSVLSAMFLELMVRVFHDVSVGLGEGRAVFDDQLKTLPEADQLFYKQSTQTDMFSVFLLKQRLKQRDHFNIVADHIKRKDRRSDDFTLEGAPFGPNSRRSLSSGKLPVVPFLSSKGQSSGKGSIIVEDISRNTPPSSSWPCGIVYHELQYLELPSFNEEPFVREEFIDTVLATLEDLSQDKVIQANCVYLSAYYMIAKGDVMKGMDLFCETLQRLNSSLVPIQELYEVIGLLDNEEKILIQDKSYYKQLIPRRLTHSTGRHMTQANMLRPVYRGGKTARRRPLLHSEFLVEVKQENIARDAESAGNLFSVLQTVGHSASVSPEIFQTFLDSWKQVLQDNDSISCMFSLRKQKEFGVEERVLTAGYDLKCNTTGHCLVVLTTHRVIILSNAGLREKTFAELPDLQPSAFCKCDITLNFLGPKTPVIKQEVLEQRRESGFIGRTTKNQRNSKTDPFLGFPHSLMRDIWYRIIKEVISGWKLIYARKDPSVMDQVECHVKMMIALYQTGWMDGEDANTRLKWAQKLLSFHSKPITVATEATDALQYRINPNIHQTEKATIESTLFVPPNISGGEGKLMLGMGNGCLRVYDMEAKCFESDLKIVDSRRRKIVRVSCLLLVDFHVWVGCLGRTIHILDVETLCYVSQLSFLDDDPKDLALSPTQPKIVWTLLLNGTLLGFDPETRERVARIQVPDMDAHSFCTCFTIWKDCLWVGTNRGVIAVLSTVDYSCVNQIFFPGTTKKQVDIKYLAVSSEDEIWCSVYSIPRGPESTFVAVINPRNGKRLYTFTCPDSNHRISFILPVKNTVWCGTKCGKIYVFSARTENNSGGPKVLDAHDDKVRSMAATDGEFVISGTGSNDGYANVWRLLNWFDDDDD